MIRISTLKSKTCLDLKCLTPPKVKEFRRKCVAVGEWALTHSAMQEAGEFGQIRLILILLEVVEAVDMLEIHVQLSEVFGEDTRPWVQDAPKIGLGQLLPLVQSH